MFYFLLSEQIVLHFLDLFQQVQLTSLVLVNSRHHLIWCDLLLIFKDQDLFDLNVSKCCSFLVRFLKFLLSDFWGFAGFEGDESCSLS